MPDKRGAVAELTRQPLVSVVTPFYNTELYLSECIESVLAQTYGNLECILVDNCSTDGSLSIAQEYERRDSRVRIVSNPTHLTQVQNYNTALRCISPESVYCKIVQADDWIFPECLERMVEVAESDPSVGIVSSYRLDDRTVENDGLPYPSTVISGSMVCRMSLNGDCFVFGSPTSVLFRSDIVRMRDPFYNESSYHEDTEACYDILRDRSFGFVHQVLTFTRRENESISSSVRKNDPGHILDRFTVVRKYGRFFFDETEYRRIVKATESQYLRFLASRVLRGGGPELRRYHVEGMTLAGYRMNKPRFIMYVFLAFLDLVLNPKKMIDRLLMRQSWRNRLIREA